MTRWIPALCAAVGATLLLSPAPSPARGGGKEPDRAADKAAIRARAQDFFKALAQGTAQEVAANWTASGEYIRDDLTLRGRASIEKAYAEHRNKVQPGSITIEGESIRFLSDDAAVQEGVFVVNRPNPAQTTRSQFTALFVRSKGTWYYGQLRETSEAPSLQELAWLVGTWTFPGDGAESRMVVEWAHNKRYLLCRTTSKGAGETSTATQIVAVHPGTGAIQSWTFESDGSLGESVWSRTAKGWTAKVTSITADGEEAMATTILTPVDENTFTFQSTERTVDGERLADVGPIKVRRVATGK